MGKSYSRLLSSIHDSSCGNELHLEKQRMTDEEFLVVCGAIADNRSISHVHAGRNYLTTLSIRHLISVYNHSCPLVLLDLSRNKLTDDSCEQLVCLAKCSSALQTLNISFNSIGTRGAVILYELGSCSSIECIDIRGNPIPGATASALKRTLSPTQGGHILVRTDQRGPQEQPANRNTSVQSSLPDRLFSKLRELGQSSAESSSPLPVKSLSSSNSAKQASTFKEDVKTNIAVAKCTPLRKLKRAYQEAKLRAARSSTHSDQSGERPVLFSRRIGHDLFQLVLDEVQNDLCGSMLDLSKKGIDDILAAQLAEALQHNTTIVKVSLAMNEITDTGCRALAHALYECPTVNTIDLSFNNIGYDGACAIAELIQHRAGVRSVLIGMNPITEEGQILLESVGAAAQGLTLLWAVRSSGVANANTDADVDGDVGINISSSSNSTPNHGDVVSLVEAGDRADERGGPSCEDNSIKSCDDPNKSGKPLDLDVVDEARKAAHVAAHQPSAGTAVGASIEVKSVERTIPGTASRSREFLDSAVLDNIFSEANSRIDHVYAREEGIVFDEIESCASSEMEND